ncbi:MAG: hypothetical protein LBV72_14315 [Tannerella sp.]|jgi:hypothetical protein|nr:hypothetical protein [Tannerella sp.]
MNKKKETKNTGEEFEDFMSFLMTDGVDIMKSIEVDPECDKEPGKEDENKDKSD